MISYLGICELLLELGGRLLRSCVHEDRPDVPLVVAGDERPAKVCQPAYTRARVAGGSGGTGVYRGACQAPFRQSVGSPAGGAGLHVEDDRELQGFSHSFPRFASLPLVGLEGRIVEVERPTSVPG
jgi:hypothetical protein